MCELTVYALRGEQPSKVMEGVVILRPQNGSVLIENIFGESREVEGKLGEVNITAQKAADLMDTENILATADEEVDVVLKRMARSGVKEMAIVDENKRILADITAVDLLRYYHLEG